MSEPDEILHEFLQESHENLDQVDQDLVALEKGGADRARLDRIFRAVHTIKGTCGFFGFARLGALAHAGEGLLGRLRDGRLPLTAEIVPALLALVDALRGVLAEIDRTGQEGSRDHAALTATLTRLQEGTPAPDPMRNAEGGMRNEEGLSSDSAFRIPHSELQVVRVDVGLLDKLMDLVGELVLARNRITQLATGRNDPDLTRASQRLSLISGELQEGVMRARMQPIGSVWRKLPRLARDLAHACGKQVRLSLEGEGTELDRGLLEAVKDPLTHLLRNAIDHGLEAPTVRTARGKPAEGRVWLRAAHENGQFVIEVGDDGTGIDPAAVRSRALGRRLISAEQAERLGDHELVQLIFLPGFSTAERVTDVSGRGVGMDVVKTNVERAGGTVDLESRPGFGTTVRLRIPLTLAIIPALVVASDGDRYAVPQAGLVELVRLAEGEAGRKVERVHGVAVFRLRGRLLPLVDLREVLRLGPRPGGGAVNIAVLQAGDRRFGLVVDRVIDTQEILVKPLARPVKAVGLFAGATILGDGRVALILDVPALARGAQILTEDGTRAAVAQAAKPDNRRDGRRLLLCELGADRRLAVPLELVERLEQVPAAAVEASAGGEVIQHAGRILPLVRLAGLLGCGGTETADRLQVVVCAAAGRRAGLVVDHILDTVEDEAPLRAAGRRPGVAGSAVIGRRVTDLLDVAGILSAFDPEDDHG